MPIHIKEWKGCFHESKLAKKTHLIMILNLLFSKIVTYLVYLLVQWAPLNGITLGPRQTDPISQMIPLTDTHFGINSKQALDICTKMIPLTE